MRALEKDRERRYQTAWDMQYAIDQFLTHYEFTPSNIHISNFLKQLFEDELEEEQSRVARRIQATAPVRPAKSTPSDAPATAKESGEATAPTAQQDAVSVKFEDQDLRALTEIAEKRGVSIDALVREIVSGWLKRGQS